MPVEITPDLSQLSLLFLAGVLAGGIDAMVGGGGLIQLPSLLVTFPQAPLPTLFGSNKFGSAVGTACAAVRYLKEVRPPIKISVMAALFAFIGSFLGANFAVYVNPITMRPIVIFLLVSVAIYTVCKPQFGSTAEKKLTEARGLLTKVGALSLCIGMYDGFFGPGTGTFFLFGFVMMLQLDFITASVLSKVANLSTNCAALLFFIPAGHISWSIGIALAAGNLLGAQIGSSIAVKKGGGFVRIVFLFVVTALTARLSYLWSW